MQLITYEEAASMLNISVDTLRQALKPGRDVLTKVRGKGRAVFLVREQVRLFVGVNPKTGHKKRLSFEALTPQEKQDWQRCAEAANTSTSQDVEAIESIVDQRVSKQIEPLINAFSTFIEQWQQNNKKEREVPKGTNPTRERVLTSQRVPQQMRV